MEPRLIGEAFHHFFKVVLADSPELQREAFRIRYRVYCEELGYECGARYPDRLERDRFDPHSMQCLLLHRPSGRFAGCVRLVMGGDELPMDELCRQDTTPSRPQNRTSVGEISRLAVACQFRRRPGEVNSPDDSEALFGNLSEGERRLFPHISLGLYLAAAAVGLRENLDGVFALMEPRLARRLRFYGIRFDRVGELIEHRGQRAVHFISRDGLLNHLLPHVGALLEAILGDLGASPAKSAKRERHARRTALGAC